MSDAHYCYPPDYTFLKNLLNIRDKETFDRAERRLVSVRMTEPIPQGDFDLSHIKATHRHLFQDVFEWAGEIRLVEISKGGSQFQLRRFIETGMADIHKRLEKQDYLKGCEAAKFASLAGEILGDINYVHPFREGNGRTQLMYLKQLSANAGHNLDLTKLEKESWINASREAHLGNYQPTSDCIAIACRRII